MENENENEIDLIYKKKLYINMDKTLNNCKQAIYSSLFGDKSIKKPVDSLIYGYLIGYLTSVLNIELDDNDLTNLKDIYFDSCKLTKDLDLFLDKLIKKYIKYFLDKYNN
jgi:hypothetical protein